VLVSPRYEGPPIISITGALDDQLAPVSRQRRRLESMLVALSLEDWGSASRCEGWTVQDVVAHVVGVNAFWLASVRAGLAGEPTRFLAAFDPVETPALMVAQMRELTASQMLNQLTRSNDALLDVIAKIDDGGWAMLAEAPPGHLPIRLVAHHALWDCWIHERDIAIPLGLSPPTESDEVRSCLSYVCALSPALAIGSGVSVIGEFAVQADDPTFCCVLEIGETVAVRSDVTTRTAPCLHGDAVTLVEALSIRAPLPASAPTEWLQLLKGLATAFNSELPDRE
jgi:uncharacterized protein (TIGR03083 family)